MHDTHEVTQLLEAVRAGAGDAADRLWQAIYGELHGMAVAKMGRERNLHTLQPTALVSEVYLRLFGGGDNNFENRRHFFAAAARAMHRICVDYARQKGSIKRGGQTERSGEGHEQETGGHLLPSENIQRMQSGAEEPVVFDRAPTEVIALDDALKRLADEDPELVELVRLRYFVGLGLDETADVLGVSRRTVAYRWRLAKAWLFEELGGE